MFKKYLLTLGLFVGAMSSLHAGEQFQLKVGAFKKSYDIKQPHSKAPVKIAYIYDYGDNALLIEEASKALMKKMDDQGMLSKADVLVVPGDKANAFGGYLAGLMRKKNPHLQLVILRSTPKAGAFKSVPCQSVTSLKPKKMYMREDQFKTVSGKNVLVFDDVVATGGTMKATQQLLDMAGAKTLAYMVVATEGEEDKALKGDEKFLGKPLLKLAHMPLIPLK